MKTSLLTTLSFLLLFSTKLLLARSTSPKPVYDANGDEVKSNLYYYVKPALYGPEGGLGLFRGINSLCPFDVVLESFNAQREIKFSPYDNSTIVRESTDLNVIFIPINVICRETKPPIWKVSDYDPSSGNWFIHASGKFEEGNPGAKTLQNWFKLERDSEAPMQPAYKFVHCPSVCQSCAKLCNSLGFSEVGGATRLALIPDKKIPYPFILVPGTEKSTYNEVKYNK